MMSYPDFSSHGYKVERELGKNLTGGRITYLAKDINVNIGQTVVIKQFQFTQAMGTWRDYDAIHQEIKVLQRLNHRSIPRYLNSFDTSTGFCLVQEYKNAPSLAKYGSFNSEGIQQIAIQCLEILVYLQRQQPYIIHRDIKPENILLSQDKKVYLVDFGLAKLGEGEVASTIAKGTFGFMPPEQIHQRQLTKGTDLYSLGATLICLLTGTESINIGNLIDDNERIRFKSKLPKLSSPAFVKWLEKMVERKLDKRFQNAEEALKALKSIKIDNNVANVGKTVRFSPKLVKISTISLLTICLSMLGVYQINKHIREQQILAERERIEAERERIAKEKAERERIEAERERIEAQKQAEIEAKKKQALIIKLQETKSCINCDLSGANLKGLFLDNVNLENANLKGADLSGTKLKAANLSFAKLQKSQLKDADLEGANLQGAELEYSNLHSANLIDANLKNANLQNAELQVAHFSTDDGKRVANLENVKLQGANLNSARLRNANLENANLQETKLQYAQLQKANLENANLQVTSLQNARLSYANLKNADLTNADLSGTYLEGANLDGAKTVGANFEGSHR